jgi:hypothetical protein
MLEDPIAVYREARQQLAQAQLALEELEKNPTSDRELKRLQAAVEAAAGRCERARLAAQRGQRSRLERR